LGNKEKEQETNQKKLDPGESSSSKCNAFNTNVSKKIKDYGDAAKAAEGSASSAD
jgi:hypothetical protein